MVNAKQKFAALAAMAISALLMPMWMAGQEPGSKPETSAPAQAGPLKHPDNDYWRKHDEQLLTDFPWLARFHDQDEALGAPKPGEDRVVFMGDSITEGWHLEESFPGKPYINRGISGQTTPQMGQGLIPLESLMHWAG